MMIRVRQLAGVVLSVCLVASPAAADVVTDWNAIAQATAAVPPGRPGPSSLLDFAMVHAAMHDAIQAIQGRYHTYSGALAPAQGSEVAAAAAAAHGILVNRFPAQTTALDTRLNTYLGACDDACQDGVAVGVAAANAIITMRQNDGSNPAAPPPFLGCLAPGETCEAGEWRPTSFAGTTPLPMVASWLGDVVPFTMTDTAQFQAEPVPSLTSREYTRNYNEVKRLGSVAPSDRTPEQDASALFFREGPPGYWGRTLVAIVGEHVPDTGDRPRLYALVYLSMADAIITAWHDKKFFNFWRPVTAIRLGDFDGNPNTVGDPAWTPHTGTPNYPDYTSGANNLNGAVTKTLEEFFGTDEMSFSLLGANSSRPYERFSDVADDVCEARILEGIHFRFADTAARTQGREVAKQVFMNYLRPIED